VSNERVPTQVQRLSRVSLLHLLLLTLLLFALGRAAYYLPALVEQLMRLSAGAWG
jgi:hypothetical protein